MKVLAALAVVALFSIAGLQTNAALAYGPRSGHLSSQLHQQTIAPIGFYLFCLKNPNQCRPGGQASIPSNSRLFLILQQVNLSVNRSMTPRADPGSDTWTLGAVVGDCEDYVLNKRALLMRKGMPPSALRIAYVKTSSGADHTVLIVVFGRTGVVLDNLTNQIRPLRQSGLTLISMSGANPIHWS